MLFLPNVFIETMFKTRIPLKPSNLPFVFKILQFSIKVCLATIINKCQGQTLKYAGIDLKEDCIFHSQFYVTWSHVSHNQVVFTPSNKKTKILFTKKSSVLMNTE